MVRHPDGAPAQGVLPSSNNDAPAQQPLHNPPISQQQAPPPQPPMANQRVPPHQPPQMHPGMNQQAPPLQPPMANQQVPPQQPPQMHPGMNQQAPPPQPPMANQLMPPQQPPQMHPGMNQQAPPPQPPIANQQVPPQQPPQMHPGMNQQAPPPQPPMANQQVPPQQPPQMHPGVNQQAPPPQPPMANQQVPPQQPPQMHPGMNQQARPQEMLPNQPPVVKQPPPHLHQPPPPSHQIHSPDSLPPKPRQMQFQPPAVVHNDAELDFYSRLPSPKVFESDSGGILDNPRHFIALTVNVTPAAKDCYFYEAVAGFDVDFQVLGGDGMDIGLAVFDPSGVSVALRDPVSEANIPITVQPYFQGSAYAICLDNRKASYGRKKVFLAIDLRLNWNNPSPAEQELINKINAGLSGEHDNEELLKTFENFERLTTSLDRISTLLHRTQRLQQRSRNNAAMDRAMMEANQSRVTTWSTFQVVLLLLVGVVQTLLIRSLFDEKSSLYRLWVHGGRGHSFASTSTSEIAMATETTTQQVTDLSDPAEKAAWQTANQAAEKVSSLYYRSFDKHGRPDLPTFYVESATLLWNGNRVEGRHAVVDFLATKLPKSQTTIHSISAQPVQKSLSGDKTVVMVNTFGTVKFDGNPQKIFSETFFLIKEDVVWRIQSATFRFIE
ncbi:unnamed protein product [Mesocestoides corti]|uniref:NTF2 domain-containing protein n=1 Tax=Mesocestoides corti TaxID=53468 RepID=A0A0R3UEN2_MESCO|nr:unnamed protein product [Mesocestoides corti]